MGYFDDEKNVQDYINMVQGYDGGELIDIVTRYVADGSTVLELGMGPGKDMDILKEHYRVTGSDSSDIFLHRYRETHRDADLLFLDAVTLETDRTFDCVYSNKVLIHLTKHQLQQSLLRQKDILNQDGILFHSFWKGDRVEEMHDLLFVYYKKDELAAFFGQHLAVLEIESYTELEKDDSLYVVARNL